MKVTQPGSVLETVAQVFSCIASVAIAVEICPQHDLGIRDFQRRGNGSGVQPVTGLHQFSFQHHQETLNPPSRKVCSCKPANIREN